MSTPSGVQWRTPGWAKSGGTKSPRSCSSLHALFTDFVYRNEQNLKIFAQFARMILLTSLFHVTWGLIKVAHK